MRKLYVVLAILITGNVSVAQQVNSSNAPVKKHYLSNNPASADDAYRADKPTFFNAPSASDAYREMIRREMDAHRGGFNEQPTNDAINGLDYDVKYYRIEIRVNPDTPIGKYIKGAVTTYFTNRTANFNQVNFDFATALLCDSVYYHGVKLSAAAVVKQADTLRITIPTLAAIGTLDSVKVFYKGVPPNTPGFSNGTGYVKSTHNTTQNYVYTLSEPYSASTWWPCKSRVTSDKADSVDIIVNTPSAFNVAANGTRVSEVTVNTNNKFTTWRHRYPISSYQVAIGVANYVQYPATPTMVNIGGTNMPYYNLVFPESLTTAAQTSLDRTVDMLEVMSDKFGDYPFKKEKYGHYSFGFGGGMEHNTFSGMNPGTYNETDDWDVIAHELGHQWFGAAVTCGSWADIWVNESFARYSEVVYLDFKTAGGIAATALTHRNNGTDGIKTIAISNTYQNEPVVQTDTTSITTIFSPSVYVYERGAMFVSMLRKMLGDTKFFQAIKNYQTDPALQYSTALTADVKRHMQAQTTINLDEMFTDWITKRGYALYNGAQWNNVGNQLMLFMPQTTYDNAMNTHFDMPVVVRIQKTTAPTRDTSIILFDQGGNLKLMKDGAVMRNGAANIIQIGLTFTPTTVTFDPYAEVLANGSFAKNTGLALLATNVLDFSGKKEDKDVKLLLTIDQSNDYASFEIERSLDGSNFTRIGTQAAQNNGATSFTYVDHNVPSGVLYYRIKVIDRDGSHIYTKTITISSKNATLYTVTPNPAKDFILIGNNEAATAVVNVRIVDSKGRVVLNQAKKSISANSKLRVELANVAAGNYYVEIENDNKDKVVEKIVVIR